MIGYETPGHPDLPDGQWLVVNRGGRRWEFPIAGLDDGLTRASVADEIEGLDADELWAEALAGADMATRPAELLLRTIAERLR
jgi:hypothetical protein